ncbi:MAG: SIMPL domain-containing protein [Candidatus Portnoybacteria bacterium]|nr:SIMPL domain-containing protein [Candidatus Portnoybacteria bacterium]
MATNDEKKLSVRIIPPHEYIPYMFILLVLALIVFLGVVAAKVFKESQYIGKSVEFQNTITVSGQGKILAKPDIGRVDLSALTESKTVADAVSENNQNMNKVVRAMKKAGISENDLKTAVYNINPKYQYTSGKSSIIGYEVVQTLAVKIRELDKSSEILDAAATAGANQIGSLSFTIDDPEKIKEEATQKAIANAKEKAGTMAQSLGIKLGRIIGFDENSEPTLSSLYYGLGGRGSAAESALAPEVQVGQNEITVSVNLTYEVK